MSNKPRWFGGKPKNVIFKKDFFVSFSAKKWVIYPFLSDVTIVNDSQVRLDHAHFVFVAKQTAKKVWFLWTFTHFNKSNCNKKNLLTRKIPLDRCECCSTNRRDPVQERNDLLNLPLYVILTTVSFSRSSTITLAMLRRPHVT